jgi:phospholipid/cholesterol/gamma-HCH transport system substrate-binding protein
MGLIESEGGVAADYYLFDDRVRFSLDAWNFNSKEPGNENMHLKAGVEYRLGDVFFVNAGYDNFRNRDRAHAFAGIGIRFDDEDLKYLLGSVPLR